MEFAADETYSPAGGGKARHGAKDALPLGATLAAKDNAQLVDALPLAVTAQPVEALQPLDIVPAANTEDQQSLQAAEALPMDKLQCATSE